MQETVNASHVLEHLDVLRIDEVRELEWLKTEWGGIKIGFLFKVKLCRALELAFLGFVITVWEIVAIRLRMVAASRRPGSPETMKFPLHKAGRRR